MRMQLDWIGRFNKYNFKKCKRIIDHERLVALVFKET